MANPGPSDMNLTHRAYVLVAGALVAAVVAVMIGFVADTRSDIAAMQSRLEERTLSTAQRQERLRIDLAADGRELQNLNARVSEYKAYIDNLVPVFNDVAEHGRQLAELKPYIQQFDRILQDYRKMDQETENIIRELERIKKVIAGIPDNVDIAKSLLNQIQNHIRQHERLNGISQPQ